MPLTSIAKGDESAAMAAMFQAQSAVWEETQEKMSQFVSPLRGFLVSRRIVFSNESFALLSVLAAPLPR